MYMALTRGGFRRLDATARERDDCAAAGNWHEEKRAIRRVSSGKTPVTCLPACRDAPRAEVLQIFRNAPDAMAQKSRSPRQTTFPNPPACSVWNRTGRRESRTNHRSSCTSDTSLREALSCRGKNGVHSRDVQLASDDASWLPDWTRASRSRSASSNFEN